jgi:hypothetical protein
MNPEDMLEMANFDPLSIDLTATGDWAGTGAIIINGAKVAVRVEGSSFEAVLARMAQAARDLRS